MSHEVHAVNETKRISGAGGYFAAPGTFPPKAGAFAPRKKIQQKDNIFGDSPKEKTSKQRCLFQALESCMTVETFQSL